MHEPPPTPPIELSPRRRHVTPNHRPGTHVAGTEGKGDLERSTWVNWLRASGPRKLEHDPTGEFQEPHPGPSATVTVDHDLLRGMLRAADESEDLFPGMGTELGSRPSSKVVRLGGTGMVEVSLEPRPDGRLRIGIAHEGLPSPDDVEVWKAYWEEWLAAIDQA